MIKLGFLKYWLISTVALVYSFIAAYFPELITWETPKHITVIMNIILSITGVFYALMIMSCWSEDMMSRTDSFKVFGERKIWRIWQWVYLPMMIWSIYMWSHFGILVACILFYFGLKVMITNQNKHYDSYKLDCIKRAARQEQAEKVTL